MRRTFVGLAALAVGVLGLASPAQARIAQATCQARALQGAECGTFPVPLDHADPAGRQLSIGYALFPAREQSKGTVVLIPGGPGETAVAIAGAVARGPLAVLRDDYDLMFADPRGTGRSSPLRCAAAPRGVFRRKPTTAAITRCAEELGEARRFFTTHDQVLDLEVLRQFLEVPRIIPVGVSYGGSVAGAYARRFPASVQALVLDSTSPIEGTDALGTLPQLALPRVLTDVCFPPGCEDLLGEPYALLEEAVKRMTGGGLRGRRVLPSGATRPARVTLADLYAAIRASDADPFVRSAVPSIIQAASRGDAAPLLRLLSVGGGSGSGSPAEFNELRFLATQCTGARLPWAPDAPLEGRRAALERALVENADAFAPFPVSAVATTTAAAECLGWPATPPPPPVPSPDRGPDVPVLVLAGRLDLRTPLEDQRRAAAQYPNATVVAVPEVGHSVLVNDEANCARVTLRAFLEGKPVGRCTRRGKPLPLALPAVWRLRDIPLTSARGDAPARVQRTVVAVDLTLRDLQRSVVQLIGGAVDSDAAGGELRVPGLRGGSFRADGRRLRLVNYEAIEGVRVSGTVTFGGEGTLTITGRGATGTLFTPAGVNVLRGTLDGVQVRYRGFRVPGTL